MFKRLRFGLRSLLVAIAAVSVLLAYLRAEWTYSNRQRQAAKTVLDTHGFVDERILFHGSAEDLVGAKPSDNCGLWLRFLSWISNGSLGYRVQSVQFGPATELDDFDCLEELEHVKDVELVKVDLVAGMIQRVGSAKNVRHLGLVATPIPTSLENEFDVLDNVTTFSIVVGSAAQSAVPVRVIDGMTRLQYFHVRGLYWGVVDLGDFGQLARPGQDIRGIELSQATVKGDCRSLSPFSSLRMLAIWESDTSAETLQGLDKLPSLRYFICTVTDMTPKHRALFESLHDVSIETWPFGRPDRKSSFDKPERFGPPFKAIERELKW
jgi:hypothetical protein